MATCFIVILSVVVFSCSCQSSNTGYSSKGILLQVSSHLSVCEGVSSSADGSEVQIRLGWTVFINRQSSSLLRLWFWLKVDCCGVQKAPDALWGEGVDLRKRETERGLNPLIDPPAWLHSLWAVCPSFRGQRWNLNSEDTVAGCPKGFLWWVQSVPLDLQSATRNGGHGRIKLHSFSLWIRPSIPLSSPLHLFLSSPLGRSRVSVVSVSPEVSVVPGGTASFGFQDPG